MKIVTKITINLCIIMLVIFSLCTVIKFDTDRNIAYAQSVPPSFFKELGEDVAEAIRNISEGMKEFNQFLEELENMREEMKEMREEMKEMREDFNKLAGQIPKPPSTGEKVGGFLGRTAGSMGANIPGEILEKVGEEVGEEVEEYWNERKRIIEEEIRIQEERESICRNPVYRVLCTTPNDSVPKPWKY